MKYLCLIYNEEAKLATVPQAEIDAVVEECRQQDAALKEKGRLLASERLQPVSTATTLRPENGKTTVIDGPFAETREQLGGFYLIDAADLDEAIRIAGRLPPARFGCVEIRPVWDYS